MKIRNLLGAINRNTLYDTLYVLQIVFVIIIALSCIVMVIGILASPAETAQGQNAITGASESYYTKNKNKGNKGRVQKLIVICASIIAVCAILYFVAYTIYPGE